MKRGGGGRWKEEGKEDGMGRSWKRLVGEIVVNVWAAVPLPCFSF